VTAGHSAAELNIAAVAKLEQEFLNQRSVTERMGDVIAGFAGSITFVILHLTWFTSWLLINTGNVPATRPFDPFPFVLLSVAVSCEAVLLSTLVLIKQNRMSRRADQRDHLNLQIGLLSEKEITTLLKLQRLMCDRMGIRTDDPEVVELAENTTVESVAKELDEKMPA
jgi:uncharacterized membrane protein